MPTASASLFDSLTAEGVVKTARRAWEIHGKRVGLEETPINGGPARLTSLVIRDSRRIEYIVESDDPDVWDLLATNAGEWQRCALVRLDLIGTAHERLCDHGFELQGWWFQKGQVAFGGVEVA